MLRQLVEQAKKIENETDANISGALIQVTDKLSIEECEISFSEYADNDPKKVKRFSKKILRVKDVNNPYHNINGLRQDICCLLENARNPRSDKNYLWL